MSEKAFRASALSLAFWLLAAVPGHAQAPKGPPAQSPPAPLPITGFVPPYEIMRTVRAAGFDPLAPPLREGTTYVLRATDYRGILMRVVVDARTGAIRDANRIVPGPDNGEIGMEPTYGPPPYGPRMEQSEDQPDGVDQPLSRPPARLAPEPSASVIPTPPLPRPRPPAIALRKSTGDANFGMKTQPQADPPATPDAKVTSSPAPTAPRKSPAAVPPMND